MGRAIVFIFFIVAAAIFWVIKAAVVGTKAAYEAVFDPAAPDRRIQAILEGLYLRLEQYMRQNYAGDIGKLRLLVAEMVPLAQSYVFDSGYKIPSEIARQIVIRAVIASGRATEQEVQSVLS